MNGSVAALILAFLLATAYAALFHLFFGGTWGRILAYVTISWFGFALGHIIFSWFNFNFVSLGVIHIDGATLGAIFFLFVTKWLLETEE